MKFRKDFVTNSSSSSFIILVSKEQAEDDKMMKILSLTVSETSAGRFISKDVYLKNLHDFGYLEEDEPIEKQLDENETFKARYNEIMNHYNNGGLVYEKCVDYYDEAYAEVLRLLFNIASEEG